jgi:hypothetical protein
MQGLIIDFGIRSPYKQGRKTHQQHEGAQQLKQSKKLSINAAKSFTEIARNEC